MYAPRTDTVLCISEGNPPHASQKGKTVWQTTERQLERMIEDYTPLSNRELAIELEGLVKERARAHADHDVRADVEVAALTVAAAKVLSVRIPTLWGEWMRTTEGGWHTPASLLAAMRTVEEQWHEWFICN